MSGISNLRIEESRTTLSNKVPERGVVSSSVKTLKDSIARIMLPASRRETLRRLRKPLLRWAGVVIAGAALYAVVHFRRTPPTVAPPLTAPAVFGPLEQMVLARGRLEPAELVNVGAQVSGQVKMLAVALGQKVHAGDPIAEIDSLPQQNALRVATAEAANLHAQRTTLVVSLQQATRIFQRQAEMLESDATSRLNFEAAEANMKMDQARIEAVDAQIKRSETDIDTARINLGYTKIISPISGVVVNVVTKQGQTVNSSLQTPTIVVLARLNTMIIKAQISEADVVGLEPGLPAFFTILGAPNQRYHATLRMIEPAPSSLTAESAATTASQQVAAVYYNGVLEVPNPRGELRPSMTAEVHILVARRPRALLIPITALGQRNAEGRYLVQVVNNNHETSERSLKIGINNGVDAEVLDGLNEGERVVIGDVKDLPKESGNGIFSLFN